jgi:hypothetical protein
MVFSEEPATHRRGVSEAMRPSVNETVPSPPKARENKAALRQVDVRFFGLF